jgi:4,5-DOPA dioxygenase extradiol
MPVLFVVYSSPTKELESNEFTKKCQQLGASLPKRQALLCISVHRKTKGTYKITNQSSLKILVIVAIYDA